MKKPLSYIFLFISLALYICCLFQPAFTCQNGRASWVGYEVLFLGWLGLIGLDPRWLANIGVMLIWLKLSSPSINVPLLKFISPFILICATSSLVLFSPIGCPGMDTPTAVSGLALGGYLWVVALLLALFGLFISSKKIEGNQCILMHHSSRRKNMLKKIDIST